MLSPRGASAKQYKISDLLPEVFLKIFKYLTVNERKTVKLVCKSWLQYCNMRSLLNDEVLNCLGVYQLSDIYELLGKSERQFLSLKFENVKFGEYGSSFWKKSGLRIRSIHFEDCQFSEGILEKIIIVCENLFHLSFKYGYMVGGDSIPVVNSTPLPIINVLEKILRKGIVRENLQSLEIDFLNSSLFKLPSADHILSRLFLIFPEIKTMKIYSNSWSDSNIHISPILNYLNAATERIEKLKLDFTSARISRNNLRRILKAVSSLNRLTELRLITSNTAKIEDIGTVFYSMQLQSLEFGIDMSSSDLMLFLSQLLHSNSSLQYLKINQPLKSVRVSKPFYEKLMSSGLRSFVLRVEDAHLLDPNSFGSCLTAQCKTMVSPSLSIGISLECLSEDFLPFLQYRQNLLHLKLQCVSYNQLQFLLKYQKKLKSLKVLSYCWLTDYVIDPNALKFNEFADIEYLELAYPPAGNFFLTTLSPEPILAKLKYLRIDVSAVDEGLFASSLLRSVDAMPFLEAINIKYGYDISFDNIVKLCTKLSRLRYLYYMGRFFVNDGDLTNAHYRKLFSICPLLRAVVLCVWDPDFDSVVYSYFFDTIHKKVVLKQGEPYSTLSSPRIDELTVPWLQL